MLPGSGQVADPTSVDDVYASDFSSRATRPSSSTCWRPVPGCADLIRATPGLQPSTVVVQGHRR